jgi:hypothetical protein
MRFNEIKQLMEAEPVPKLSSLWQYSDEFSPEVNAKARDAAFREIENIRTRNKQAAAERRGDRKNFEPRTFESFGIDLPAFMKDYCDSMYDFLVANPDNVSDYVGDMAGVTPNTVMTALINHVGTGADAVLSVLIEALTNPGPDVEDKYESVLQPFNAYLRTINKLGPIGKQKAKAELYDQIRSAYI